MNKSHPSQGPVALGHRAAMWDLLDLVRSPVGSRNASRLLDQSSSNLPGVTEGRVSLNKRLAFNVGVIFSLEDFEIT